MSASIQDTCKKLLERNCEPAWVWSMLLSQGLLTWDNVWEAFPDGVAASQTYRKLNGVQGAHMLLSLPDAPKNIVDVFQRLAEIEKTYPYSGHNSYDFLTKADLCKHFLAATHGFVQCTWPQVKAVLDSTTHGNGLVGDNLRLFFESSLVEQPAMVDKALVYMMQNQHAFVGNYAYNHLVHARREGVVTTLWDEAKKQQWVEPAGLAPFLATYSLSGSPGNMKIPVLETLAFIEKHPAFIKDMAHSILSYGERYPKNNAYFEKTKSLFFDSPKNSMALTVAMQRSIPLDVLKNTDMWNDSTTHFGMKPLLQAYLQMDPAVRDTKEAEGQFARMFRKVHVDAEAYLNEHSNELMAKITTENPTGSMARILALHACVVGVHPKDCTDKEVKQLKTMFKHDPRSKTGFASIVKKCLPDMKAWLSVAESVGLSRDDIWENGLLQLATPLVDADLNLGTPIDSHVFE